MALSTISSRKNGVHRALDQSHDAICQNSDLFRIGEWGTQGHDHTNKRHKQINRSKMTIFFSKSTNDDTRNQIKLALGVLEIMQYERYLGLPSLVGRNKKASFNNI